MVVANITTKSSTQREKEKPTLGQRVRSDASSYVPLAQRQTKQSEVQTSNELQKINSSKNSGDEKPRVIPIPPISKRTVKPLSPVVKKGEEPSHHSAKECHAVTASQLAKFNQPTEEEALSLGIVCETCWRVYCETYRKAGYTTCYKAGYPTCHKAGYKTCATIGCKRRFNNWFQILFQTAADQGETEQGPGWKCKEIHCLLSNTVLQPREKR